MKQVSVLKIMEGDSIRYGVIISEEGKPHNTYCIYNTEEIAYKNANCLAFELNARIVK